jgi:Arc/MetJ-type ribon-helix-helix transcriptional regulator
MYKRIQGQTIVINMKYENIAVAIRLPRTTHKQIVQLVKHGEYINCSDAIRSLLREALEFDQQEVKEG